MPFAFGDEPSNTGDSIGIQCMVNKGDLPIDFRWTLNGSPIISGENSLTLTKLNSRTSTLNVEYLDGIHRGIYKCVASNRAGSTEFMSNLEINGLFQFSFYNRKFFFAFFFLTLSPSAHQSVFLRRRCIFWR